MPRLMSVSLTEQAVRDRRKTVTRRLGWATLEPGMELDLCRKVMGRRKGDPLVRVARVRVVSARRDCLSCSMTDAEVRREGFTRDDLMPQLLRAGAHSLSAPLVAYFSEHMRCDPHTTVTRIEWEYLPTPTDWPPL